MWIFRSFFDYSQAILIIRVNKAWKFYEASRSRVYGRIFWVFKVFRGHSAIAAKHQSN